MSDLIGYRVKILPENLQGDSCQHFSGGSSLLEEDFCCPNCKRTLFPAFVLDSTDEKIRSIVHWKENNLIVYFCPSCCFYMEDYWLEYKDNRLVAVYGGEMDGGDIVQDIDFPFKAREIQLEKVSGSPTDELPKHLLGGAPPLDLSYEMACQKCSQKMPFLGVLAYDDLNIPLYENGGNPVALIIGDYDCINIYSCSKCSVLGMHWAH